MSNKEARILGCMQLMEDYDHVDPDFVAAQLHCGRGQAMDAIRKARHRLAEDRHAMDWATPANGYSVSCDNPDSNARLATVIPRLNDLATRAENISTVITGASLSHLATTQDRRLARKARQLDLMSVIVSEAAEELAEALWFNQNGSA